jgi:DNA-binding SARP family transcriptional activator
MHRSTLPPALPSGLTTRPRLDALFAERLARFGTVGVFAAAGSGKTVGATQFGAACGRPMTWLSLAAADRDATRLLEHIAAALGVKVPSLVEFSGAAEPLTTLGEVAALLADSLGTAECLVVLDNCEAITGSAGAATVLEAFLDYRPPETQVVLLGRDELETPASRMHLEGRLGKISDADLALDPDEAAQLAITARDDLDPDAVLEWSRGWIAAFRLVATAENPAEGERSLACYISSQILDRFSAEERQFLLKTSLLKSVSAQSALRLCGPEAYDFWRRGRVHHLPATLQADRSLEYYPPFREFLLQELNSDYGDQLEDLRRRHAHVLSKNGQHEEAMSVLLDCGDVEGAAWAAEEAVPGLIAQAEWTLLLQWFEALGNEQVSIHPVLQAARIRSLYGTRQIAKVNELIHQLRENGEFKTVVNRDPGVIPYIGQAMLWKSREALEVLDSYPGSFYSEAIKFELKVLRGRTPATPPRGTHWSELMERIVSWALLVQGRLDDLTAMLPSGGDWPPANYFRTPHPLLGFVWRGDLARARTLISQVPEGIRNGVHSDFWYFHEAWLCWAEGDLPAALIAAKSAVEHSSLTGFGWEPCFDVMTGFLMTLQGQHLDAEAVLDESLSRSTALGNAAYVEWARTFKGLTLMRENQNEKAAQQLRMAWDGMHRSRRLLFAPFAGIFRSEVEWRLGNEDLAQQIADEAYEAAAEMGAVFILRRALELVPNVIERQITREKASDRWRRIQGLRTPRPAVARLEPPMAIVDRDGQDRKGGLEVRLEIQPFGEETDIIIDGRSASVRRLKVIEVAACLTLHPEGISRRQLQGKLFPDTDQRRGGNHFRQIVYKLRSYTGISPLRSDNGVVTWPADVSATSADLEFERLLAEASNLSGTERLESLSSALRLVRGSYLQDSSLDWVETRRCELEVMHTSALVEAAEVALGLRYMDEAREYAERALASDPYSEAAYRALIRVEAAVGVPDAALTVYRRLTEALADLNLRPDGVTEALVHKLRGR